MKNSIASIIVIFFCTALLAQTKNIKGQVSSIDTADLSILNVYPASFPDVSVVFRAETKKGEPVWGLTKEKMRVKENGNNCNVISLEHLSRNKPINLGIVVDHSGSMGGETYYLTSTTGTGETIKSAGSTVSPIDSAKKAVKNFVKSFNATKDFISLIGFSSNVDVRVPLTQDIKKINLVIDSMQPILSTALYDAMIAGIDEIRATEGIKVLVVLTDGYDNSSVSKWKDVAEKANKENVPVYIVGLGNVNKDTLQLLAAKAKGKCYFTESSSSLDTIYSEISKQIQAFYDLVYRSENFSSADTSRDIELRFDIDSIYLVTSPSPFLFPQEVLEAIAKKDRRKDFFLYGGIGIVALVVTGLLLFRFVTKTKNKKNDSTPVIKKVFPNPSQGPVTIQWEGNATQLQVFDMKGQMVKAFAIAGNEIQFNLSSWPRGNYIIVVHYGANQSNAVQLTLQ